MNFQQSAYFPMITTSFSCAPLPMLWHQSPRTTMISCSSSPMVSPSFTPEIPFVVTPNPVPSYIPSSSPNLEVPISASLPLRSASFDLSNLIAKARWRREKYGEYLECAFCKSNGESYEVYSSHRLRDNEKAITLCPILRAHQCPRCHVSGDKAHTMKYCPIKAEIKANRRLKEIEMAMKRN